MAAAELRPYSITLGVSASRRKAMASSFGSHFRYSATTFNFTDRNLVTFFLSMLSMLFIILLSPVAQTTGWHRSGPVDYRPSPPPPQPAVSCSSHAELSCIRTASLESDGSFPDRKSVV